MRTLPKLRFAQLFKRTTRANLLTSPIFVLVLWYAGKPRLQTAVTNSDVLHQLGEQEFVTGERILNICDVAFFPREYVDEFPSVRLNAKALFFVDEPFTYASAALISRSRTFFLKPEFLKFFIREVDPLIREEYVLFTHMSDETSGEYNKYQYKYMYKHILRCLPRLLKWYGCNMSPTKKTEGVPLGLENVDMWKRTNYLQLMRARHTKKKKLLYFYFNARTNLKARGMANKSLSINGFSQQKRHDNWSAYIEELAQYKFCASPQGNGVDTHRMWECLYLGVIPVVVRNPILQRWFSGLPILWIDSFQQVTPTYLESVEILAAPENLAGEVLCTMTAIKRSVQNVLSSSAGR